MQKSPSNSTRKRAPSIRLIYTSHVLLYLALGCILFFLVPEFAKTFQTKTWQLPSSTQFIVQLSKLAVRYWYVALFLTVPYYFVLRIVARIDAKSPGFAVFWLLLIWFFGAFILMYWAYALILPFQMADGTITAP
jgi:type II secretory pathway component PulF